MSLSINVLPGATCAVIRMKITTYNNGSLTKWRLWYKESSDNIYLPATEENVLDHSSDVIYGSGPLFYDLYGLKKNTSYSVKLEITEGSAYSIGQTVEKSFTTCPKGSFEFHSSSVASADSKYTTAFNSVLNKFKEKLVAVGYDYSITGFSADIYCDSAQVGGAAALTRGYKGKIYLKGSALSLKTLAHEYRHYLGLSQGESKTEVQYHGNDPSDAGIGTGTTAFTNICKIIGFCGGRDGQDAEIYMFYGENSIDSIEINKDDCPSDNLLQFFLIKALGLNTINIY